MKIYSVEKLVQNKCCESLYFLTYRNKNLGFYFKFWKKLKRIFYK